MAVYIVYEEFKSKYCEAQKQFNEILQEKEAIFAKTQPKSPKWDKIDSSNVTEHNNFDNYLINKESKKIDERLAEIKAILDDRERLLKLKEKELMESRDQIDKIYKMKYIRQISISEIIKNVNYSKSQVYRMLDIIKRAVK